MHILLAPILSGDLKLKFASAQGTYKPTHSRTGSQESKVSSQFISTTGSQPSEKTVSSTSLLSTHSTAGSETSLAKSPNVHMHVRFSSPQPERAIPRSTSSESILRSSTSHSASDASNRGRRRHRGLFRRCSGQDDDSAAGPSHRSSAPSSSLSTSGPENATNYDSARAHSDPHVVSPAVAVTHSQSTRRVLDASAPMVAEPLPVSDELDRRTYDASGSGKAGSGSLNETQCMREGEFILLICKIFFRLVIYFNVA